MKNECYRLQPEISLYNHLWELLQCENIQGIRSFIKSLSDEGFNNLDMMGGQHLEVTEAVAPDLYALYQGVMERIKFNEPTELYIASSPELNAFTIPSIQEGKPHIIVLSSGLIEKFTDDELRFVIGHELGHIVFKTAYLKDIVRFLFGQKEMNYILQLKVNLWEKLSELSADRVGLMATNNFETCVRSFFKLSSGMSPDTLNLNIAGYISQINTLFDEYLEKPITDRSLSSHPLVPIRIRMLNNFYTSDVYRAFLDGKEQEADTKLTELDKQTLEVLYRFGDRGLDLHRKTFIAITGLIIANVDNEIDDDEIEKILNIVGLFDIFPDEFLQEIVNMGPKQQELLNSSVKEILSKSPGERQTMFNFLCEVIFADKKITEGEVGLLIDFGKGLFGYEQHEVLMMLDDQIREKFIPGAWKE